MHPILCVRFKRSDTGTLHLYRIILSPELRTRLIDYESIVDLGPNKNRVLHNSTMASSGDNKKHEYLKQEFRLVIILRSPPRPILIISRYLPVPPLHSLAHYRRCTILALHRRRITSHKLISARPAGGRIQRGHIQCNVDGWYETR